MRSRRSSRDSRPSAIAEDGSETDRSQVEDEDECYSATGQRSPKPGERSKKVSLLLKEDGVWAAAERSRETLHVPALSPNGDEGDRPPDGADWTSNKEKMEDVRNYRRSRSRLRSPWTCSLVTLAATLVSGVLLWSIVSSFRSRQCDAQGCRMSRMSPVYLKVKDFDTEHSRFASKYDLYLYRENGIDEDYPPKGVPVLFIPGNAGSYRQVRSIAAEAARYYKAVASKDEKLAKAGLRNLDFFTVDFNEDITAFHGQTMLDQAEYLNEAVAYILSLYHDSRKSTMDSDMPDPSSVIIFGHSMGGIVARTMLIMPNYQANSINTIITMSAPHARPPVSFDKQIVKTYDDINNYWMRSFSEKWANNNPLWHVTLVSIAGGGLDNVVPSDYASISSLVPDTHGFTVFTSSIPDVWLGVDHLAILWCDQLMKATARAMLDVVDVKRAGQTKPRAERMRILRKWLLTGMEDGTEKVLPHKEPTTLLTLQDDSHSITGLGHRLVLREFGTEQKPRAYLMPIPPSAAGPGTRFTLLTDQKIDAGKDGKVNVLFCSVFPLQAGHSAALFSMNMDLSGDSTGSTRLACKNAADDVIKLPASTRNSKQPFDPAEPFSYLQYQLEDVAEHQFVAVVDKATQKTSGWLVAEFASSKDYQSQFNISLPQLLVNGVRTTLAADRPLVTELNVPIVHSSLFAYRLTVAPQACGEDVQLFTPLVRQYLPDPHESKLFVNVHTVDINLHGTAPFIPPALRPSSRHGLSLQFWSDPTCNTTVDVKLEVDIFGSLGRLVMRYRTVFAAFPLLIVALVLRKQFQEYDATGRFISFGEGMDLFVSQSLGYVLLSLALLALSLSFAKKETKNPIHSPLGDRTETNTAAMEFAKNDLLVGLQDPFFWFLAPMFAGIAVGVTVVLNYVMTLILHGGAVLCTVIGKWTRSAGGDRRQAAAVPFSSSSPRRRILTTLTLLFFVATLIPYQFAYMVACIVQGATCIRALRFAKENGHERSSSAWDFYHYTQSVLVIMLWILPINLPVLVVWHHNLAVHWLTPFASHHNVLSVMPFILLVETLTTGNMIPRLKNRVKHVTSSLLLGLGVYAAVYGVTYAYRLHHLVNILAAWFVAVHFSKTRPTITSVVELFTEEPEDGRKKRHH